MYATGIYISPYEKGNIFNRDPLRDRKLLLHRREINRLFGLIGQKGVTIIPLSMYFSGAHVKIELGVCRGKKLYDKRDAAAKKQAQRDIERFRKNSNSYCPISVVCACTLFSFCVIKKSIQKLKKQ